MCGIAGFIRTKEPLGAKKNKAMHWFLNNIFLMLQVRGTDATGFFFTRDDKFFYHKRAQSASSFVLSSRAWKSINCNMPHACIMHTRHATNGAPCYAANNHPFVSKRHALVHNGTISNWWKLAKERKFDMHSMCDSEILLHLYEEYEKDDVEKSLENTFKAINGSAAMAILPHDGSRLILGRNDGNSPLAIFKMPVFNAIMFVSTESIFERATERAFGNKDLMKNKKFVSDKFTMTLNEAVIIDTQLNCTKKHIKAPYSTSYGPQTQGAWNNHGAHTYSPPKSKTSTPSTMSKTMDAKKCDVLVMTTDGLYEWNTDSKDLTKITRVSSDKTIVAGSNRSGK
jgi:glucosamine 6-phosphate synthetase-like amidotransferase/phosphosugar isomerase protein